VALKKKKRAQHAQRKNRKSILAGKEDNNGGSLVERERRQRLREKRIFRTFQKSDRLLTNAGKDVQERGSP